MARCRSRTRPAAFGGAPHITFASAAFYQVGHNVVPQFMAGLPMVLSVGFWAGGARLAVLMGPLLGAAAVFTFGGLTARLVGPRWAPAAALTLAVCQPEQFTSRSTYSETLAQVLFLGALCLWIDTQRTDPGAAGAGSLFAGWRATGGRRRTCWPGSPGCCSASRCWCGWTGRATSCSWSRTAGC